MLEIFASFLFTDSPSVLASSLDMTRQGVTQIQHRMFEKDPDQSGVPDGFTAYLLRWKYSFYAGNAATVTFEHGLPHVVWEGNFENRPLAFPGEASRIFVRTEAAIDERVFAIPEQH